MKVVDNPTRWRIATWQWAGLVGIAALWTALFHIDVVGITVAGAVVGVAAALLALLSWRSGATTAPVVGRQAWLALPVLAVHLVVSHLAIRLVGAVVPLVVDQAQVLVASATSGVPAWGMALFSAVVVAPMEELWWRATMHTQLLGDARRLVDTTVRDARTLGVRRSDWLAIARTTLAFCLFHVATGSIPLVGAALLGGIAWGWLRARTGGILAPIVAHAGWTGAMALFPPAPV